MNLNEFEVLVRTRRAVRKFKPDPVGENLLRQLLAICHWAPSGYNLQPTHYILVMNSDVKARLCQACMGQKQVLEAAATVVFTGDRRVVENNLDRMVELEKAAGAISGKYEKILRYYVSLAFSHRPLGLGWLWKACLPPLIRWFRPVPAFPAVHKQFWLAKQTMLNAMIFMLAARAAGLATVPMEGFDETRVRKVLNIPSTQAVLLVVPVGYAADGESKKSRLPVEDFIHRDGW